MATGVDSEQIIPGDIGRVRSLTEKGFEMYEIARNDFGKKLENAWKDVDYHVGQITQCGKDTNLLCELESDIIECYRQYCSMSALYVNFLTNTRTEDSLNEIELHKIVAMSNDVLVQNALQKISRFKQQVLDSVSHQVLDSVSHQVLDSVSHQVLDSVSHQVLDSVSHHSQSLKNVGKSKGSVASGSAVSKVSSVLIRKHAKAEAARVRLEFAEKEAIIRKQQLLLDEQKLFSTAKVEREKADLNVDLDLLLHKKEAAAAEAEVQVLRTGSTLMSLQGEYNIETLDPVIRTRQYVEQQSTFVTISTSKEVNIGSEVIVNGNTGDLLQNEDHAMTHTPTPQAFPNFAPTPRPTVERMVASTIPSADGNLDNNTLAYEGNTNVSVFIPTSIAPALNPDAPAFHASNTTPVKTSTEVARPQQEFHEYNMATEFTRFLLKKDLLFSRLTQYNDRPESFATWKASFLSIMRELQVTAVEEIDLLVKWLGPASAKYALSIRASNVSNPSRGLTRIWDRLEERFGCPEMVEAALKSKINDFPKLSSKDNRKLYELADILAEIECTKENSKYSALLAYYDSSSGTLPIVNKLPYGLQEKWTYQAAKYKREHNVSFPPFTFFAEFVHGISKIKNYPGFAYDNANTVMLPRKDRNDKGPPKTANPTLTRNVSVSNRKTDVSQTNQTKSKKDLDTENVCPIHKTNHSLNKCRGFRSKPYDERKKLLKEHGICFRCCETTKHNARLCKADIKCSHCGSVNHTSALHIDNESKAHGGEDQKKVDYPTEQSSEIKTKCSQICGERFRGKSCAKIVLVSVYPSGHPEKSVKMYAILDDQSNRSLAKSEFFTRMSIFDDPKEYSLTTCAGIIQTSGRRASGFVIEALDGSERLNLPTLVECDKIPDNRDEIPTPEVARHYPHLTDIATHIPSPREENIILLLIGRDLIEAHHILEQRIGPRNAPYAQKLRLGWVLIGESCLNKVHRPGNVYVNKTHLLSDGRTSIFEPCHSDLSVKEYDTGAYIGDSVFLRTPNDDKPGLSVDDREFLNIMDTAIFKDDGGNWVAPLPFKNPRPKLPNNKTQALNRAKTFHRSLRKDFLKMQHMVTFMQRVFENQHAELAPPISDNDECWYLPLFGVYHPQKPNQIRVVFDSSAVFEGLSLNNVLLSGPDLTNNLLHVLLRFRMEPIAVTADIEQMFHSFLVKEDHRNYLRFFWYRNNSPSENLVEYRMRVHVFGNCPSPAVANYGLRKTARDGEKKFGSDVRAFVENNFYVDDGLISFPTANEAIDVMKRTQAALKKEGNLRLHKIASNCEKVMCAFPNEDLAKDIKDLDFENDQLPLHRSLGMSWYLEQDTFTFRVSLEERPYSRRGLLSVINSIFDPLGLAAPVVVRGKLILRKVMSERYDWDDPLPAKYESEWQSWKTSLPLLENIQVRRTYMETPASLGNAVKKELHVYSDASEQAIAAVAYLYTISANGDPHIGFVLGKVKVAPTHGHTIPRLELCGAVLAVEIYETISDSLGISFDSVQFHIDSKVVLGYLNNRTRRFYMYVSNRVDRILRITKPEQWKYIPTKKNPADCGTRSVSAEELGNCAWVTGPTIHSSSDSEEQNHAENFPLMHPEEDKELRPQVQVLKASTHDCDSLGSHRFERFSHWKNLIETLARLQHIAQSYHNTSKCKGWHICSETKSVETYALVEQFVIKTVQREVFKREFECIKKEKPLPRDSRILNLDPIVDENGLLRIGGRLNKSKLSIAQKTPIIIPGNHHIAILIIRFYHEAVKHQGRHFTDGAVRAAGFWILGGKRLISSVIYKCVKCRKLRGKLEQQKMSDLPQERLEPSPPFTYVGLDTFGPWSIVTRRTRGGQANNKRWAILFTCLTTRAIHIEVVEELSTSSFINSLRRFIALRGNVKELRSDRGTNFVGSVDSLKMDAINVEDGTVKDFLYNRGAVWVFNPPHSSHMGGVWERMIGVTRRILDSMMTEIACKNLTHEVLCTFMAEVCAIVNARPLVPVSSDSDSPFILSPSMLLTQKTKSAQEPFEQFDIRDMYKAQWKRVQVLADIFWKRWKQEYLQTLQYRRKWQDDKPNIQKGDVVLLKDKDTCRNDWPMGVIVNAIPSGDNRIRKAEVCVIRNGKRTTYTRPVTEMVLLINQ